MTNSILLADDHAILRQGLRILLEAETDFIIIGETGDGLEALQLVDELQPDVVVLDLTMPSLHGLEVTRQIKQNHPDTRVVVLSMHSKEAYVYEALRSGADAYVLKGSEARDLIQAIRQVLRGQRYLSSPLNDRLIEAYLQKIQTEGLDSYDTLTNRERQVLHLAVEGLSNAEIAARLVISSRTVEVHRANMMRKLNLNSQADLIRFALKRGILPMDEYM